jgi:hypothetical protein
MSTPIRTALPFAARVQNGPGGHRVEAAKRALPLGAVAGLDQGQEPGQPGDDPGARGGAGMRIGLVSPAGLPPESSMLDWLTSPADPLLRIGGVVAGWFFSKDATSFAVVQMMVAMLVLAAFVTLLVFSHRPHHDAPSLN